MRGVFGAVSEPLPETAALDQRDARRVLATRERGRRSYTRKARADDDDVLARHRPPVQALRFPSVTPNPSAGIVARVRTFLPIQYGIA